MAASAGRNVIPRLDFRLLIRERESSSEEYRFGNVEILSATKYIHMLMKVPGSATPAPFVVSKAHPLLTLYPPSTSRPTPKPPPHSKNESNLYGNIRKSSILVLPIPEVTRTFIEVFSLLNKNT